MSGCKLCMETVHPVMPLPCKPPSAGCLCQQEKPSSLSSLRDQSLQGAHIIPGEAVIWLSQQWAHRWVSLASRLDLKGDPQLWTRLPFQTSVWSARIIKLCLMHHTWIIADLCHGLTLWISINKSRGREVSNKLITGYLSFPCMQCSCETFVWQHIKSSIICV